MQLEATAAPERGGAVAAFVNPGGIRADLIDSHRGGGEEPGEVTYGEAFEVQPMGNHLVTMTLTGAQLLRLLEQQWSGSERTILQVSTCFTYSWEDQRPQGRIVRPESVLVHGEVLDPEARYRITVNNFLAGGGDGFSVLTEGTDRRSGPSDIDALNAYLAKHGLARPSR